MGHHAGGTMNWDAEAIKVLVFSQLPLPDAPEVWEQIVGTYPDNAQKKGLPAPFLSTASGTWKDYALNVIIQAGRIEVNITGVDPDPSGPVPVPPIPFEKIDGAVDEMRSVASWLHKGLSATRFAAASQLVKDVNDEAAAVQILNDEVKGIKLPADSDSIIFQLNKKKQFGSDVTINRLLKFGTARLSTIAVGFNPNAGRIVPLPTQEQGIRAYMHIDVNNRPLDRPLSDEDSAKLVDHLWSEEAVLRRGGWNAL
jgi:hypothetical protein